MDYKEFLARKRIAARDHGVTPKEISSTLFDFQRKATEFAIRKGRAGLPDYLIVFRKPGENTEPVSHTADDFPVEQWQQWASPVWMDIKQTRTLNVKAAREPNDEKHVCPLQLDLIERCLVLWSNEGDVVFSPFTGIGSEGVTALKLGRKFIGTELKESYWKQACAYLHQAEAESERLL